MAHFALTALGEDRLGIVAAVTAPLAHLGCNLEDSSSTNLRGHFAVMIILAAPPGLSASSIAAEVTRYTDPLGLLISVRPLREEAVHSGGAPTHVLSVYGADRPGIVHGITQLLSERQVNITELSTRLVGSSDRPVYTMIMEVAIPSGIEVADLERALRGLAGSLDIELTLAPLDLDAL